MGTILNHDDTTINNDNIPLLAITMFDHLSIIIDNLSTLSRLTTIIQFCPLPTIMAMTKKLSTFGSVYATIINIIINH